MRLRLHMLTMDPLVGELRDASPMQAPLRDFEDPVLDGPISRRVAVLDFDDKGRLRPGVKLLPLRRNTKYREFDWGQARLPKRRLPRGGQTKVRYDRNALKSVSVFTTIYEVLDLFEHRDALGRKVDWAFPGEQILVVPRAGDWANAFYERSSRSLQFFSFKAKKGRRSVLVETCLSPDIVAHEAAHAVLDGIAPDLYDAVSPQSLAIHEAVADLTAVFFTLELSDLRRKILEATNADLNVPTELGWIAEEFGAYLRRDGGDAHLRSLYSADRLDQVQPEPHAMSVVLSSAIFAAMRREYERLAGSKRERLEVASESSEDEEFSSAGIRLWKASWITRRVLYRALDYLPPGDSSFADLGRAMIAADAAAYSHEDDAGWRGALVDAFVARSIVAEASALEPLPVPAENPFTTVDLTDLLASDWYAYRLVTDNRALFNLPPEIAFDVRPRLITNKTYWRNGERTSEKELIFKVSWWETEPNAALAGVAANRRIRRGSTVLVGLDDPQRPIRLRLTNARLTASEATAETQERDRFLGQLAAAGRLMPAEGPEAEEVRRMGLIPIEASAGVLRIRELGAMLHLQAMSHTGHAHGEDRDA